MMEPLPRLICLHGGGTSAKVFQIQTVRLQRALKDRFLFTFVNGPFPSAAGPGVSPFFDDMGPFYRWLRQRPGETGEQVTEAIEKALRGTGYGVTHGLGHKEGDRLGPVVGVLGFSQGGGIGAGLLLKQLWQIEAGEQNYGLRFGIFCMSTQPPNLPSKGTVDQPESSFSTFKDEWKHIIHIPSVHLHGLQDPYLPKIRQGYPYFKPGTAKLIEMDLEHRLPVTNEDNELLVQAIIDVFEQTKPTS